MNSVFHAPAPAAESRFPLSFAQERMWFLYRLAPANASYHVGMALRCTGMLDVEGLHWALSAVVRRHDVLRTVFGEHEGIPYQRVDDSFDLDFEIINSAPEKLLDLCLAAAIKPFRLESAPGIRAVLLRLSDHDHVLQITLHHIISDAWSMNVILAETAQLYEAFLSGSMRALPTLQVQYWQFASEERTALLKSEMEPDLAYWRKQLEGMAPTQLPVDRMPPSGQTNLGAKLSVALHSELVGKIQELCRKEGLTLFMVLVAGLQVVLGRWSAQEDITVGTAVANRKSAELEALIGLFVNTLVIRTSLSGNPTVRELCKRVRHVCLGAYAHQDLPFDSLVIELNPQRNSKRNPLFQTMFTLENAPAPHVHLSRLRLEPMVLDWGASAFDMALSVWEAKGRLEGWLEFNTGVFEAATMKRFGEHWSRILGEMTNDPEKETANLEMLSQEEHRQILEEWGHGERVENTGRSLQSRFEEYVVRTPQAVAVQHGSRRLSYMDLEQRTNQTANYLKKLGVGPEILVGVCIQRSLDLVVALLGILKAGGAYVPLDPEYPEDRLAFMLEDAKASIVMTHTDVRDRIPSGYKGRVIDLQEDWYEISAKSPDKPGVEVDGDNLAYMIYTSGSTGRPKGVMNSHGGLLNRLLWMQEEYRLEPADVVLQKTPFGFDVSVWEFFWPLLEGAKLVLARPGGHQDPGYLAQLIEDQQITTLHFVPSMLAVFLEERRSQQCRSLRRIMCSGEALPPELARRCLAWMPWAELHNLYGPTEAAIDVTYWKCLAEDTRPSIPIGKAIANIRLYVVNEEMNPVPVGVLGELCLGGIGLARGYWGRGELTAERFVPDGLSGRKGERLYRTGDLARWLASGNVEYLGRLDQQVKIRGFRIELGEIETALQEHVTVQHAAVIVENDKDSKRLVAYVVPRAEQAVNAIDLKRHVRQKLPEAMVPAIVVEMKELPLTPSGKLDRKRLPKTDVTPRVVASVVAPRTEIERCIAEVWQEFLQVEKVGVEDNFFDLGGHSLMIMRIHARLAARFSDQLEIVDFFTYPTIAALAKYLERPQDDATLEVEAMERADRQLQAFAAVRGNRHEAD
jgi:amino acid adenylation domain-containing protein